MAGVWHSSSIPPLTLISSPPGKTCIFYGKHKKQFINRKNATSFRLIRRSQEDSQSEYVLDPVSTETKGVQTFLNKFVDQPGLKNEATEQKGRPIDDFFETLYEEQYANECEENGAEETDGGGQMGAESASFLSLLNEERPQRSGEERFRRELPDSELKDAVLRYAKAMEHNAEEGGAEPTEDILVRSAKGIRWDCESVLSMNSNLYNHPTEIREPIREGFGGRKGRALAEAKGTAKFEEMEIDGDQNDGPTAPSVRTRTSMVSTIRPKGETPEERRIRKSAVKEERKERRKEKKTNKEAFKAEKLKLEAQRKANQPKTRPIH